MAVGMPIVASALDGVQEVLRDGEDAALVPPVDGAQFADRACEIIAHPEIGQRYADTALAKVRAGYSAQMMSRAVEAIYLRYLEGSP
jgi:glycosyltransferase involved in cell wall biosynthesis